MLTNIQCLLLLLCFRDVLELQNRVANVEFQNKKLVDELSVRNRQLEASDELNSQLSVQIDSLNADIKSCVNFLNFFNYYEILRCIQISIILDYRQLL